MKMTNAGQALIESVVILPTLLLIVIPSLLALLHLSYVRILTQHQLYEFLICNETKLQENNCDFLARTKLNATLVGAKLSHFYFQRQANQSAASAEIQTWYARRIKVYEQIQTPLH